MPVGRKQGEWECINVMNREAEAEGWVIHSQPPLQKAKVGSVEKLVGSDRQACE